MTFAHFDTTKTHLHELLKNAESGRMQLPDFQRGWVWDDFGIQSLLASISQSFPCGAIMTLQSGGDVRFRPRGIQGREKELENINPETLLLDGQQRITSLYQACMRKEVIETISPQKRRVDRWYYIDMQKALDLTIDREEAILGIPKDKKLTRSFGREIVLDLSAVENEYESLCFPFNEVYSPNDWMMGFFRHWDHDAEKSEFWFRFQKEVLDVFAKYQMPVISLSKETPKEAVCLVFEKVNTGGKKLDAFELLTAIYAADEFNLRDDWYGKRNDPQWTGRLPALSKYEVLKDLAPTDFLQSISLLHTLEQRQRDIDVGKEGKQLSQVSCSRAAILNLPLDAYCKWADQVQDGFAKAAKFLSIHKIFWRKDIPYKTQIVPLATIFVRLGTDAEVDSVVKHLTRWFWCGVFGELYGSAVESRFALDAQQIPAWAKGEGETPRTIEDANFSADRLYSLRSRQSAAYKGVHALLMNVGAEDFKSGKPFEYSTFWDEAVDIHHIFPRDWCEKIGNIPRQRYDSVINKTPLASQTNRIIGGAAPSQYLARIAKRYGCSDDRLDEILSSHLIGTAHLQADDFGSFYTARESALLEIIQSAMGKAVSSEAIEGDEADDLVDPTDEDDDDDEAVVDAPEDVTEQEAAE